MTFPVTQTKKVGEKKGKKKDRTLKWLYSGTDSWKNLLLFWLETTAEEKTDLITCLRDKYREAKTKEEARFSASALDFLLSTEQYNQSAKVDLLEDSR